MFTEGSRPTGLFERPPCKSECEHPICHRDRCHFVMEEMLLQDDAEATSAPFQPPVYVQAGVAAGVQHYLPRRSGILQGVVMPKGDTQVTRNVVQTPTPAPVSLRPSTAGNHGTIKPGRANDFKSISVHCPAEGHSIKGRMAYEHRSLDKTAQIGLNLWQGLAVFDHVFTNPVKPDVEGVKPYFRIDQDRQFLSNLAGSDADNSYLANTGRVRVCRFNVNCIKRKVAHHSPQPVGPVHQGTFPSGPLFLL